MNPSVGLVERDLNAENKMKGKRRAVMSMGGKPVGGDDTLSPKSLARRTAVCPFLLREIFYKHCIESSRRSMKDQS
jgi:hypothetical protein